MMTIMVISDDGTEREVVRNVHQYVLIADDGSGTLFCANCTDRFLAYAVATAEHHLAKSIAESVMLSATSSQKTS